MESVKDYFTKEVQSFRTTYEARGVSFCTNFGMGMQVVIAITIGISVSIVLIGCLGYLFLYLPYLCIMTSDTGPCLVSIGLWALILIPLLMVGIQKLIYRELPPSVTHWDDFKERYGRALTIIVIGYMCILGIISGLICIWGLEYLLTQNCIDGRCFFAIIMVGLFTILVVPPFIYALYKDHISVETTLEVTV